MRAPVTARKQSWQIPDWARTAPLLGLIGVVASLCSTGFDVIGVDQQLYVPFLRKFANPSLYPGDFVFAGANFHATAFVPVFGTILRLTHCDITTLQVVGYLVVLFIFMSGLSAVIRRIAPWPAPLWGILLFCWPLPIPGSADGLYEPNFHPHTLGIGLALWSLSQLLAERFIVAAALAALAFLFHPLIGVAALAGSFLGSSAFAGRSMLRWALSATVFLAIAHAILPAQQTSLSLRPVSWWLSAASANYLWFESWSHATFATFAMWLILAVATWRTHGNRSLVGLARFGAAGLLMLLVAIVGMQLRSPLLVSLQLHRGFFLFEIATVAFTARRLTEAFLANRLTRAAWIATAAIALTHSAAFVLATLIFASVITTAALSERTWWARHLPVAALLVLFVMPPRPRYTIATPAGWLALQQWANHDTNSEARFLAPLYFPDFRVYSQRPSVLGTQDAAPTIFDEEMAAAVAARSPVRQAYADRSCSELHLLAQRFKATFVVTEWSCEAMRLRHQESGFYVYEESP